MFFKLNSNYYFNLTKIFLDENLLYFFVLLFGIISADAEFNSIEIIGELVGGYASNPRNPGPRDIYQMTFTNGTN